MVGKVGGAVSINLSHDDCVNLDYSYSGLAISSHG
jgi:hypothetical protein